MPALQAISSLNTTTRKTSGAEPIPSREALIDEFGELDRKLKLMEPTRKRHEELKSILKGWYEQFPAEKASEEQGKLYTLIISPREMEATAKLPEIFKLCGRSFKKFCELVSVTQTAVKKAFGEPALETCFSRERTGSRKLTVVAKSSPAA